MSTSTPYAGISLWLLAAMFFTGLMVAREIGRALRRKHYPHGDTEKGDAFASTSVLGLLALLIGFTFSIGLSRYEARRALVVHEANAIGTTWLRMQLLDSEDRSRMREILRRYIDARVEFGAAASPKEEVEAYKKTEALQTELWNALIEVISAFRDSPRASSLTSTTNDAIDLAAERFATRQAHIPARIMRMLVLFAWLGAALVGYERSEHRRSTILLFLLLTLAASLVVDLDRPSTGLINVPQDPMLELRDSIHS